jgi:hypothetical protein
MKTIYLCPMKYSRLTLILLSLVLSIAPKAFSQVNTLYFMENVPFRNSLNPAFIPTQSYYLDLPLLSNISIWSGNSAVSAADIFFKQDGMLITPFHPNADRDAFLKMLQPTSYVNFNYQQEILGFGFRVRKNFYTFAIKQRIESSVALPKDLMRLLLKGASDTINTNNFNLKSLQTDVTAYLETSLGFARPVNNRLTLGGKLKLLMGEAHADAKFSKLDLDINKQSAVLSGSGYARITSPYDVTQNSDGTVKDFETNNSLQEPMGWGAGADLGATYKLCKNLTLSASLTDLGFIHWKKSSWQANMTYKASFTGMDFKINSDDNDYATQIGDTLKNAFTYSKNGAGYTTWLTAKLRAGGEYNLVKNKITLGALWENTLGGTYRYSELTGSVNFRPFYCFNTSFSYGFINGKGGTFGFGLNLIGGPFNFFVATDYAPAIFTRDGIPYKTKYADAQLGLVIAIGHNKKNKPKKMYRRQDTNNIDTVKPVSMIIETPVIMPVDPIITAPVVIKNIEPRINLMTIQIPAENIIAETPVAQKSIVSSKKGMAKYPAKAKTTTRPYTGKTPNKDTSGVKRTGTAKTIGVKKVTPGTQRTKATHK